MGGTDDRSTLTDLGNCEHDQNLIYALEDCAAQAGVAKSGQRRRT